MNVNRDRWIYMHKRQFNLIDFKCHLVNFGYNVKGVRVVFIRKYCVVIMIVLSFIKGRSSRRNWLINKAYLIDSHKSDISYNFY